MKQVNNETFISRKWAMPNSRTFSILPIKQLLKKYLPASDSAVIVDPFANESKYGTITNDLNPDFNTTYHLDALEFLKQLPTASADCILYDPPYSITQAQECYKSYGKDKLTTSVTNMRYWGECKDEVARICKPNGIVLCFGWNSNGIGINRGFSLIEILLVAHGGSKNDTICTVEVKNKPQQLSIFDTEML